VKEDDDEEVVVVVVAAEDVKKEEEEIARYIWPSSSGVDDDNDGDVSAMLARKYINANIVRKACV